MECILKRHQKKKCEQHLPLRVRTEELGAGACWKAVCCTAKLYNHEVIGTFTGITLTTSFYQTQMGTTTIVGATRIINWLKKKKKNITTHCKSQDIMGSIFNRFLSCCIENLHVVGLKTKPRLSGTQRDKHI